MLQCSPFLNIISMLCASHLKEFCQKPGLVAFNFRFECFVQHISVAIMSPKSLTVTVRKLLQFPQNGENMDQNIDAIKTEKI